MTDGPTVETEEDDDKMDEEGAAAAVEDMAKKDDPGEGLWPKEPAGRPNI
jgi:hypothetical protein